MLTFDQIKELIDLVSRHKLSGLELERSGFRLKIDGPAMPRAAAPPAVREVSAAGGAPPPPAAPEPQAEAVGEAAEAATDDHIVTSPIVGTFYRSPNPDAEPFVGVGDRVKQGQVLCIVEAMKLMNEIESDVDGTVREVFPKDAQAVEFGEPLFSIETD